MSRIFRTLSALVAVSALLAASGCMQAQKKTVGGKLAQAESLREEVRSDPRSDLVKEELDQSLRYQEKAESYLAKSRSSSKVELKGVGDRYAAWADQMADLSLKKVHEAKIKLEGEQERAQAEDKPGPAAAGSDKEEAKDSQGPPGPLTASQDDKGQEGQAGPIVEQPLGAPTKGELNAAATDDQQGPSGPLKMEETDKQAAAQPAQTETAPPDAAPAETAQGQTASAGAATDTATAQESQTPAATDTAAQEEKPKPARVEAPPEDEPPAEPKVLYARALALYNNKDYSGSRRLFLAFLAQHPGHALAVNSQYWIGETYYAEAEYVLALGAFEAVVNQYPDGLKVPDGLVKMGLSELKLGRLGQGKKALEECLNRFPDSEAAQVARRQLGQLAE